MWMTGRSKLKSTGINYSSFPTRDKRPSSIRIKLNYILRQASKLYSIFNVAVLTSSDCDIVVCRWAIFLWAAISSRLWNGPFKWFDPVRSLGCKWSHSSSLTIEWAQTREYAASQNRLCGQPSSDKTKHLPFDLSILRLWWERIGNRNDDNSLSNSIGLFQ